MNLRLILEMESQDSLIDLYVGQGIMFWLGKKLCLLLKLGRWVGRGIKNFLVDMPG